MIVGTANALTDPTADGSGILAPAAAAVLGVCAVVLLGGENPRRAYHRTHCPMQHRHRAARRLGSGDGL